MVDAVGMFERWRWTLRDVDDLDFLEDFIPLADTIEEINKNEAKANRPPGR